MQNVKRMKNLVEEKQRETFHDSELFHHTRLVLNQLTEEVQEIVPQRQTRSDTAKNPDHSYSFFHDYLLSCGVDESLDAVINETLEIIDKLITSFENRFSCFIEDDFFTATAAFLDTKSYVNEDCEELYEKSVPIIASRYSQQLIANNCNVDRLKAEFRVTFTYVRKFLSGNSPSRSWPQLFQLKSGLGLKNILHIVEIICIVVPLANAESERIFSYLWRQLSKEWMSLNHQTLERILQLRSAGKDYRIETYDHAIDLFLTEFPDGTVRKCPRHVDGHNYSKKRNVNEK